MTIYRERLTAPPSWWLAATGFAVVWGWLFYVVTTWPITITVTTALMLLGWYLVWRYGSVTITVDAERLRVGRAQIEARYIGEAVALDRAAYRHRLGVGADARAHLMTRPYLDHGVSASINDPADPTPYWLLSSRDPEALAAALASMTANGDTQRVEEA